MHKIADEYIISLTIYFSILRTSNLQLSISKSFKRIKHQVIFYFYFFAIPAMRVELKKRAFVNKLKQTQIMQESNTSSASDASRNEICDNNENDDWDKALVHLL